MSKVYELISRYKKPLGSVIGGLNLAVAANFAFYGSYSMAALWAVIGFIIIADAWDN